MVHIPAAHPVEEIEQEHHKNDHSYHGCYHPVEQHSIIVEHGCTGFQLLVLSGSLLQVEIHVAVKIAVWLVVDGRIDQTEALSNGGHQVGCCLDTLIVVERMVETVFCRTVVVYGPVAFSQCSVSSGCLVNITVRREQIERHLGQVACQ